MPILRSVRERRQKTGVKVASFAERVGCSRSAMTSIESGARPASIELTHQIARVLTELGDEPVTVDDLLPAEAGRKDPPQPIPTDPPAQPPKPTKEPGRREQAGRGPQRAEQVA